MSMQLLEGKPAPRLHRQYRLRVMVARGPLAECPLLGAKRKGPIGRPR